MTDLGVFEHNQEILLELMTYDEDGKSTATDLLPTARVQRYEANSLVEVAHVKLREAKNGWYLGVFPVTNALPAGHYLVEYEAILGGEPYAEIERFQIAAPLVQSPTLLSKVQVSDLSILSAQGQATTFIMSGKPLASGIVRAMDESGSVAGSTTTDAQGHWTLTLVPGRYRIEFLHPNGTLLRTLEKVVN